jgi:hypothetical protein
MLENAKGALPMIPYEMQVLVDQSEIHAPRDLTCLEALDMYDWSNQATETRTLLNVEGTFPIQYGDETKVLALPGLA